MENITHSTFGLFEYYAPLLFFHPDEETYPTSVEQFLTSSKIVKFKTWELKEIIGEETQFQNLNDNDCITSASQSTFDELSNVKFNPESVPPVYCHLIEKFAEPNNKQPTVLQLQYWFFYPYNGWVSRCFKNTHRHEGDWEHITVEINNQSGNIQRVFFSKHGSRESKWYSIDELKFTDNHVHVYVARNSHACYPTPGQHPRGPVLFGKHLKYLGFGFLDDFTGTGKQWQTWDNVVNLDIQNFDWIQFRGYWGSGLWKGSDKRGPRSARWQSSWRGD